MFELLLHEKITAFKHDLWARYHLLGLYDYSPQLVENHNRQLRTFAYSPIQDAYYALRGEVPNESPAGKVWQAVVRTKNFKEAETLFQDATLNGQANLTYWLGLVFENFIVPKPPEIPSQGGKKAKQDKGKENTEPTPQKNMFEDMTGQEDQTGQNDPQTGQPQSFDLDADSLADILTGGQGITETPGDLADHPDANVGEGFEFKLPEGFKMPSPGDIAKQNEADEVFSAFMGDEEGTPREKRRMLEDMQSSQAIKNLSHFLGYAQHVVKAASRVNESAAGFTKGMTRGQWDGKVLVRERRAIMQKQPDALMRFANRKLRKFQVASEVPAGNGDVFILRDESSSMQSSGRRERRRALAGLTAQQKQMWTTFDEHPDNDTQAVNLEVALAYQFKQTGRTVTSIAWDNTRRRIYKYGSPGVKNHLESFLGGGTAINHVLVRVMDLLDQPGAKEDCADILILTDAQITDRPDQKPDLWARINAYRQRGGRIWAVLIGADDQSYVVTLRQWVDGAIAVEDLVKGEESLAKILTEMAVTRTEGERKNV